MGRGINKLSARKVSALNTLGWYGDGMGLWLKVTKTGTKSWVFRYTRNKKSRSIGLGSIQTISLTEARDCALECRKLLQGGQDPLVVKKAKEEEFKRLNDDIVTFEYCALRYINSHKAAWKNAKHAQQWENTLKTYAFPIVGAKSVKDVDTACIMRILEPIWLEKNETATRLRGRIENILSWASTQGYRSTENPARWKGHLENLLARPSKVKKVKHHKALPYNEMNVFIMSLRNNNSVSALALEFLILTAARTSEIIGAKWDEIDVDNEVWIIPGARMKAEQEHRIPLSSRALTIINTMAHAKHSDYIFPGQSRSGGLSNAAMDKLLQVTLNVDSTVHGFRSTFRDWTAERTNYPRDLCEMALAHTIKNKAEAAYRRGDMIEKRRQLMENWLKFIESPVSTGSVVQIMRNGKAR